MEVLLSGCQNQSDPEQTGCSPPDAAGEGGEAAHVSLVFFTCKHIFILLMQHLTL